VIGWMTQVMSLMRKERIAGFKGLAGTHLEATIPITQRLVDGLVAYAGAQRNLSGLAVRLGADQNINLVISKPVFGFDTRLAIDLRIRGPVDLASDSRLYLIVSRPSMTWSAISRLVVAAGLAPRGVEIARDGVAIDLRTLASRAGVADLLSLVRTIDFEQDAGVLRVRLVAEVPEGGIGHSATPASQADAPSGRFNRRPANPPALDAMLTELRGAGLRGRIAVSDELANDAIGIALDAARHAGSSGVVNTPPAVAPDTSALVNPGMLASCVSANSRQGRPQDPSMSDYSC